MRVSRVGLYQEVETVLTCRFLNRHRLSVGGSEKIQLTALLGAFKYAVELSQKR